MLALKLLLVPLFLGLVSLAGKRWGPGIAGWLAGLPIVTGPILLLLALEKGAAFTAQAASASLAAVFASVAFSIAYCWACLRKPWPHALLAGLGAWLLAACLLNRIPWSPWLALAIALATLLTAPRCFPPLATPAVSTALPKQELVLRMLAGALLALAVTSLSALIGASWSGLLAVFPLLGIVLAAFSQRAYGAAFVVAMLRAMVAGLYSFVTFCFLLTLSLQSRGIVVSFVVAAIAAIAVQSITKILSTKWRSIFTWIGCESRLFNAVPLILTLLRAALAPAMVVFASTRVPPTGFAVCLLVAFLSDVFDGKIARRLGIATPFLRRLDSIADTIFYVAATCCVWLLHPEVIRDNAAALLLLLGLEVSRYVFDFLKFKKEASYHMWSSKLWGLALFIAFFSVLVFSNAGIAVTMAIYLGLLADAEGLLISMTLPCWKNDVPTLLHALRLRRTMLAEFATAEPLV